MKVTYLDVAETQVATIASTPATSPLSLVLSDSLLGVLNECSPFIENLGAPFGSFDPTGLPRRPTSLTLSNPAMEGASMTLAYHCSEGGSTMTVTVRSPTAANSQIFPATHVPHLSLIELPTVDNSVAKVAAIQGL